MCVLSLERLSSLGGSKCIRETSFGVLCTLYWAVYRKLGALYLRLIVLEDCLICRII